MKQNGKTVSAGNNRDRNTYVKRQLTQALEELLKTKPLEALSVQELCETAMVGRASFYRNFTSKEDILRRRIQDLLEDWILSLSHSDDATLSSRLLDLFRHLDRHRDFCSLLHQRNLVWLLREALNGSLQIDPTLPKEEAYAKAYVTSTIFGWIELWLDRGMKETPEEIAGMFQSRGL